MLLDLIGIVTLVVCIIWLIQQDGASIEAIINNISSSTFAVIGKTKHSKNVVDEKLDNSSCGRHSRRCLLQCHDETAITGKELVFYVELNFEPFLDGNNGIVSCSSRMTTNFETDEHATTEAKEEEVNGSEVFSVLKKEIMNGVKNVIQCPYYDIKISYYDNEWKRPLVVVNDQGVDKMFRTILRHQHLHHDSKTFPSSSPHHSDLNMLPNDTSYHVYNDINHRPVIVVNIVPLHDARPFLNLGKRLMEYCKYEKAIYSFTKAIERQSKEAHLFRGECYIDSKEKELEGNILEDFTAFIDSCQHSSYGQQLGLLVRGSFHHDMGNYHAALEDLSQVVNHVTYSTWAHLLLALVFKDLRQLEKASQEISRVNIPLDPACELPRAGEENQQDPVGTSSTIQNPENQETSTTPFHGTRNNSLQCSYLSHDLFLFPSVINKIVRRDGELGNVFSKLLTKSKQFQQHNEDMSEMQELFPTTNLEPTINVH
ncbi:hypothetical protein C9374_001807 [Naegleria lovaniensis]|uniref:Uncharacterized protein n=1 Tax=Naegleria lovaniensis TaxID=51637 RepID=A0AA88KL49_NAELO|nr:uncharacterized protein C9374_001807 [Naegleria lovaniensis]KAG2387475.1 hypothetical protein C9374_001807 [Naegleria lovaniensis]